MDTQMPSKQVGYIVLVVGLVVGLGSGLAETVGIGGGSFGWKQLVGVIVGAVIALAGLFIIGTQSRSPGDSGAGSTDETPAGSS